MKLLATLALTFALATPAGAQIVTVSATPNADIPDDAYIGIADGNDGTGEDAGMACASLDFSAEPDVQAIFGNLRIGLTHTWIGDLTVKILSPAGTVLPVLARAGITGGTDDGEGTGLGDSSNLVGSSPLIFYDSAPNDAETLGSGDASSDFVACEADGLCEFDPNPDDAAGGTADYIDDFAGFEAEMTSGTWSVCVGDAFQNDTGTFDSVTLSFGVGGQAVEDDPSGEFAFGLTGANPFGTVTALGLRVASAQTVRATLHDVLGREVATLFDGVAVPDAEVRIDVAATGLPAGTYVVRVAGETFSTTQSLTVAR